MEWAKGLTDAEWAAALDGGDDRCPPMPAPEIQAMFVGSSGVKAFAEASAFWNYTKNAMARDLKFLNESTRILDIGVGWGRFYRWVLRDVSPRQIVGIDVDESAIQMCRQMMPYGDFRHVPLGTPYPVDTGKYDLVFLYSVFSHLSEGAARIVLSDIRDALKPGGFLALTTLRLAHIDFWDSQSNADAHYADALRESGFDKTGWWKRAMAGEYLYVGTGGGHSSRPASVYGEAVVPRAWWEALSGYRLIEFSDYPDLPQTYVLLQRNA